MRLFVPRIWAPVEMFPCHTVLPRKEKEPSVRQVNPSCFDLKGVTDHWWFHSPRLLIQRPYADTFFWKCVCVSCACYAVILSSANCEWTCEAKELHCGLEQWPTRSQGARSLKRLGFNMKAGLQYKTLVKVDNVKSTTFNHHSTGNQRSLLLAESFDKFFIECLERLWKKDQVSTLWASLVLGWVGQAQHRRQCVDGLSWTCPWSEQGAEYRAFIIHLFFHSSI